MFLVDHWVVAPHPFRRSGGLHLADLVSVAGMAWHGLARRWLGTKYRDLKALVLAQGLS